ncbi:MAG TPA: hypothetical protein VFQ47_10165 [Nitrososphaera sp.]|nr:hypothetical protein [Nitrososphaera sp.]
MNHLLSSTSVSGLPFNKTEYSIVKLARTSDQFAREAATFFVQSWMSSALPQMMTVLNSWATSSEEDKKDYLSYLNVALFTGGKLVDEPSDPTNKATLPIAAFTETMLRWLRQSFAPPQLLVEPPVPQPPGDGKVDLVEITGFTGDYSSMRVTMWEAKGSDGEASYHNSKIYRQLDDYPKRFYAIANHIASSYRGTDVALKRFLRDMARMARNRDSQIHYGVFVTYDSNVPQVVSIAPNLHAHPEGYSKSGSSDCHHLAVLMIPDFKKMRLDVWRFLHLV